jgi:hypothetical protein
MGVVDRTHSAFPATREQGERDKDHHDQSHASVVQSVSPRFHMLTGLSMPYLKDSVSHLFDILSFIPLCLWDRPKKRGLRPSPACPPVRDRALVIHDCHLFLSIISLSSRTW